MRLNYFSSVLLGTVISFSTVSAQIADPVPDIQASSLSFRIEEFVTIPNTNSGIPRARINLLRELPDGTGRLVVNDLNGPCHIISGTVVHEFLDLRDEFPNFTASPGKGTGFGAFAFHPEYATNGKWYTTHAETPGSGTVDFAPESFATIALEWVLTEWVDTDPTDMVFTGTSREMIRFSFPHSIHNLQDLTFNPTVQAGDPDYGLLYLCVGEGGSMQKGFEENLQGLTAYMGTIFRIDPAGTNGLNGQYGIPADNPFAQQPNALGEVWASGFRNPHRISWDPEGTHAMLCGDIGEANIEEVNLVEPGKNYGWSQREGAFLFSSVLGRGSVYELPADDSGYVYPVAQYDHDDGPAIVGGYVYRGQELPELTGQYICGDIANGRIFLAPVDSLINGRQFPLQEVQFENENGSPTSVVAQVPGTRADLRFGQDNAGELYILTKTDGKIRKMVSLTSTSVASGVSEQMGYWSPSPTSNMITFHEEVAGKTPVAAKVIGIDGRVLIESQDRAISLAALPHGMYIILWTAANGSTGSQMVRKE